MSNSGGDFHGTERFVIQRRLGAGGMGVVYETYDRERDRTVALKTLIHAEASAIYRFKREFRALADVAHPNLVSLYELMSDGEDWFFTMELVDGLNFLDYVRSGSNQEYVSSESPTLMATMTDGSFIPQPDTQAQTISDATLAEDVPSITQRRTSPASAPTAADLDRLRAALRQLAEGVYALHEANMLHRDIKPSNVLVTPEGRVVLLDFGLVAEVASNELHDDMSLAGTPAYMSPEQGAQMPVSQASDWYSVGVMLYEALTGRLPFVGKFFEVMTDKQNFEPLAPSRLVSNIPEDLDALCCDLLRREPEERPTGREVLERLGAFRENDGASSAAQAFSSSREALFVGRESQMKALKEALLATGEGRTCTVYVHGSSGMGKTALVRHFLDEIQRREKSIVVLEGRCYERESVPYKALDGVVDSLTKYLMSLPESKAEALMPRDATALSRLFPVMLQVGSIGNTPRRRQEIPDPLALRRRAFSALRALLSGISKHQLLVIYIDDLQWADADSAALLEDLLRPPDSPPLLLLASFRSEEIESKSFLQSLLNRVNDDAYRELSVNPLTKAEARGLARSLLGAQATGSRLFIESIVREAAGNPFLVEQLARYALAGEKAATTGITLAEMLDARLQHLPQGARELTETLAVAGRPVNAEVAYQASGLEGDEQFLIASLRASHFLRTGGTNKGIELYHDRIRETLAALLAPLEVRRIHLSLARTLEAKGFDDPESLFEHYLGAGRREPAAKYAAQAARKAAAALAFDRAALLYSRALELSSKSSASELVQLKAGLGEALANAGRMNEAAERYLDAAKEAPPRQALEFRRRAAEQLLMAGRIEEGLKVIRTVLAAVGLRLASGPKRALLSFLFRRAQLRLRGLRYREREASEVSEEDLLRIDICWSVAAGLGAVDTIRGADFQTQHLLLALRAGEPYRIARAMAVETGFAATPGGERGRKRAEQFAEAAAALSAKVNNPHAVGMSKMTAGLAAYLNGEWQKAMILCEEAAEILRDRCTGVAWELTISHRFLLTSLVYLGELGEVSRRMPRLLSAAKEQGNLYGATDLRTRMNVVWLAADEPDKARAEIIEALQEWPHKGFHLQHYSSMFAFAQTLLYTRDGAFAWKYINEQWPNLKHSMLLRIQVLRIEAHHLLARCALAAATSAHDAKPLLQAAERSARQIAKEKRVWADPFAMLIRAGIANHLGDKAQAINLLSSAASGFADADMSLCAAVARRRLGQLMTGEQGGQLIAEADAWMREQKIKRPELMTRTLAPGLADDLDK